MVVVVVVAVAVAAAAALTTTNHYKTYIGIRNGHDSFKQSFRGPTVCI